MRLLQTILIGFVVIVAFIGLIFNIDAFIFSIVNTLLMLLLIVGIIYAIYYFYFLTPDQRKYKKAVWKNKWKRRR
ncbi:MULTISPECIES: SA1362 family protein [Staphylococcus]|uniref:Uncharacterized protein n=1 Tax=Staphylococcus agnetis TaxID=985762 RepID=A0A242VH76_9STAP|nr:MULTISPECIES: SA1362 family protein [Staphylococcus]ALN76501.1 hypothetical protein EP23_03500 [Staphylococcus agnetis]MBY7663605.1 hypothetical protein [Staphylococcus agnetis]MCO4326689.1 hypothetical protein [Staphylococcus agnetis]MCO4357580.1 hypothetical protein [Staphylococcus agnetis]MCO4362214.1 hypothetical protein [Staphylococcus agnetis]